MGRWAFAEVTEGYRIESDFAAKVERAFDEMIVGASAAAETAPQTPLPARHELAREFSP